MKKILELIVFCGTFMLMVKLGAGNSGLNELYFYPEEYQKIAYEKGLADPVKVKEDKKKFMRVFIPVLLVLLVTMIHFNRVSNFTEAYLQALLFLEVMNIFDGIVIDRIWVGTSKLWVIEGMEGVPYVKPWKRVFFERALLAVIWVVMAAVVAGIVMLTGGIR